MRRLSGKPSAGSFAGVKRVYDIDLAFDRRGVTVRFSVATEYTEKEEFETWAAF